MSKITKTTAPATDLDSLAASINKSYRNYRSTLRTALDQAIEVGGKLNEAKCLVKHGRWRDWVKDNLECSQRTSDLYRKLADNEQELTQYLSSNPQLIANFGLAAADKLLRENKRKSPSNIGRPKALKSTGYPSVGEDDDDGSAKVISAYRAATAEGREKFRRWLLENHELEIKPITPRPPRKILRVPVMQR